MIKSIVHIWLIIGLEYTDAIETAARLLLLSLELALAVLASILNVSELVDYHLLILGQRRLRQC